MDDNSPVTMSVEDRDAFLGTGGTGVLSLSTDEADAPHAIPVSYGYDAVESTFYFRLAVGEDREKGELDGRAVTFVVYGRDGGDEEDGDWQSVVAKGTLADIERDDVATESLAALDRVTIPLVDIFGAPTSDVAFQFLRLVPDELSAREESPTSR
ncbi:pyridoxamine 5'-phosphate oxidase family protein [Haloarchaeobius litoreus]|uniref:Pyridoxamine 5'-phosphate oxidase family protein n=1 Tax=Haloarchaeobius litoreus TaxID=755306 RepID=A0ABD6DMP7_9EURY|nr:pyridoxamine 5'-phosphate oxidase family protein [Haloarchaeobius litoreus]